VFGYFDSSLFLAILLDENQQDEAVCIWKNNPVRISSILLKIETNISLLKFYKQNKYKFGINWFDEKKALRKKLLSEIFLNDITEHFANTMEQNDILAKCKSLDAIHLATALNTRKNPKNKNIRICSFDKNMLKVAKELGFETSGI
jgi:predicted nucleic acid-binding protein